MASGTKFELKYKPSLVPLSLSNTRDCFAFDLICEETEVSFDLPHFVGGGKREKVLRKEYFFQPDNLPENYE